METRDLGMLATRTSGLVRLREERWMTLERQRQEEGGRLTVSTGDDDSEDPEDADPTKRSSVGEFPAKRRRRTRTEARRFERGAIEEPIPAVSMIEGALGI